MTPDAGLRAVLLPGLAALPEAAWAACLPDEAEGWRYHRACEAASGPPARPMAAAVFDAAGLVLAVPLFRLAYRLNTPLQGRLARLAGGLERLLPGLLEWRMLGVGSALTERCPVALRPGLADGARRHAVAALLKLLEQEAKASGASVLAVKDLAAPEAKWLAPLLREAGHATVPSLPVAVLDLSGMDEAAYLQSLSAATRKDLRRKQRSRAVLRIEHRDSTEGLSAAIEALYRSTQQNSRLRYGDFEDLPPGYFDAVTRDAAGRAHLVLYWVGERLAAFNLLLLQADRVIDKFLGMAYPLGREHNLYGVSWMENVRFALATGRPLLQFGQTAYAEKLRLGCRLVGSTNFARLRWGPAQPLLRAASPWLGFDRWDPDLRAARRMAGAA
ncbi:acetyltransferase (GNAT) family protein [Humitalea rosea]|uniref:Acetyltransferase (GNAT) family protein n=1 Tax=Humitalea rosea TaxID=990373 RepID=A0A2W7ISG1_9PROT|nr:GNAT family N-acetyltransferase [Humitalea rosea]PZW49200.1 acetyltransferase (GNAT) family protein [Humitalea rosea]